jgi:predicted transcriptional regulator
MKITVWAQTVEYYDHIYTAVFATEAEAERYLRMQFPVTHVQFRDEGELDISQEEMDELSWQEFQNLLGDYSITNFTNPHELEVS